MCGLFGVFSKSKLSDDSISLAFSSLKIMQHRGPDASSYYLTDNFYIGHNRLAIIDLSSNAIQPMVSQDKRYILAFNGEIYNYQSLKDNLIREGVDFITNSDTEVLLQMFIRYGVDDTLSQIDGMYAGIFIDTKNDFQHIFRDPLGQKPLYYYSDNNILLFSSELIPLLNYIPDKCYLNKAAIYEYILNGYFNKEKSPVIGVNKLLPGHYISFRNKIIHNYKKWWNSKPGFSSFKMQNNVMNQFSSEFSRSCMSTLEADVPIGILLSGGVDSTLVAEYSLRHRSNIELTTVSSDDEEFDESKKAAIVSSVLEKKGYKFTHKYIEFSKIMQLQLLMKYCKCKMSPMVIQDIYCHIF